MVNSKKVEGSEKRRGSESGTKALEVIEVPDNKLVDEKGFEPSASSWGSGTRLARSDPRFVDPAAKKIELALARWAGPGRPNAKWSLLFRPCTIEFLRTLITYC